MTEQRDDVAKPTAAGLYDAYLGGTHHTPAEQKAADTIRAALPELVDAAWANRAFHQRSARYIAEQGVRQFLDLGAGLPTQDNTHQVLQAIAPGSRCVYVDFDPHAVRVGRELIGDDPLTRFLQADMIDVDGVLNSPEVRELIDLSEPVGLLASAVFHFIRDQDDPWGVARRYVDALAPGSYVALSHGTTDKQRTGPAQTGYAVYRNADTMIYLRNREQVEWLFNGLELVPPYEGAPPKVTYVGLWFCEDPVAADDDSARWFYAGVAKKP
ncbi:MAG TPA: SAM-dependent methyltransferase [Streptosporangiales bacterium]